MANQWNHKVFSVSPGGFSELALEIFRYQARHIPVYACYLEALGVDSESIRQPENIPFLPIRFFKSHPVIPPELTSQFTFESSGTTGIVPSRHLVADLSLYDESLLQGFKKVYGDPQDWCILALLPSYLERENSSLVYMVNRLMQQSGHPKNGFYLYDHAGLDKQLEQLEKLQQKTWLIGVSYALLDFSSAYARPLVHTTIVETGGMKGRQQEMVRDELHEMLRNAFEVKQVHAEYGMTELLSQAYSTADGRFQAPPWMKLFVRDDEDPLRLLLPGEGRVTGALNIIDLANVHSCSFIATEDAGRLYPDESFEVLGRIDRSELRGCSLMWQGNY